MASSGGPYESYSPQELHVLLQECYSYRGPGFQDQPENRRHAAEVSRNNQKMIRDIRAELDFQRQDKVEREDQKAADREARERASAERMAAKVAREKEREARLAREAVEAAARPPESPAASVMHPADSALKAYFQRTKIPGLPTITTERVELAWTHNARHYIAVYAASALKVWILVASGTPGATPIKGNDYMPADDFNLIHQAHIAEAKAPKRRLPLPDRTSAPAPHQSSSQQLSSIPVRLLPPPLFHNRNIRTAR
jgi:hypothetical protein